MEAGKFNKLEVGDIVRGPYLSIEQSSKGLRAHVKDRFMVVSGIDRETGLVRGTYTTSEKENLGKANTTLHLKSSDYVGGQAKEAHVDPNKSFEIHYDELSTTSQILTSDKKAEILREIYNRDAEFEKSGSRANPLYQRVALNEIDRTSIDRTLHGPSVSYIDGINRGIVPLKSLGLPLEIEKNFRSSLIVREDSRHASEEKVLQSAQSKLESKPVIVSKAKKTFSVEAEALARQRSVQTSLAKDSLTNNASPENTSQTSTRTLSLKPKTSVEAVQDVKPMSDHTPAEELKGVVKVMPKVNPTYKDSAFETAQKVKYPLTLTQSSDNPDVYRATSTSGETIGTLKTKDNNGQIEIHEMWVPLHLRGTGIGRSMLEDLKTQTGKDLVPIHELPEAKAFWNKMRDSHLVLSDSTAIKIAESGVETKKEISTSSLLQPRAVTLEKSSLETVLETHFKARGVDMSHLKELVGAVEKCISSNRVIDVVVDLHSKEIVTGSLSHERLVQRPSDIVEMKVLAEISQKGIPAGSLEAFREKVGSDALKNTDLEILSKVGYSNVREIAQSDYNQALVQDIKQMLNADLAREGAKHMLDSVETIKAVKGVADSTDNPSVVLVKDGDRGAGVIGVVPPDIARGIKEAYGSEIKQASTEGIKKELGLDREQTTSSTYDTSKDFARA